MAADTVISGVIRGILPYAVIGGVGFLGYTWLNKNGYLDGIKKGINAAAEVPSKFVDEVKNRTGITDAQNGDFIGAAQKIVRTTVPIVNVWEAEYNAVADGVKKIADNGYRTTTQTSDDVPADSKPQRGYFERYADRILPEWMKDIKPIWEK